MYRTFGNVELDTNPLIQAIFLQIEARLKRYGFLPHTLFLQVDGGSENANRYVLAACEFLVAQKVFKHVWLTRLPVGHTHEGNDVVLPSVQFSPHCCLL